MLYRYGQLSGMVEPFAGILGTLLIVVSACTTNNMQLYIPATCITVPIAKLILFDQNTSKYLL